MTQRPPARPDPDELLARVNLDETNSRRGSLKIFFGYAAGVGKTYAMLEAAHRARASGRDVVVGYLEPHARSETNALLEGLEILPLRQCSYRSVLLKEFDVDLALARKPDLLLVDELAHTNAEGCRHQKRWQDIEEVLDAGVDVWTTLNVQHLDSLNDVIGQITGVVVRETVPDHVFEKADDIELIDVSPEQLLDRLKAGKVYLNEQAQKALDSFFQKANLVALRELSLRQAARRVHVDVESERRSKSVIQPWATSDRLLVCVGPSPTTARVIRTARRMATALDAPWVAVWVEVNGADVNESKQQQVASHFRLAEQLGAETVTLNGQAVAESIVAYARAQNVTKILIGKTLQPKWQRILFGSLVDELIERSGDIDVYVIHGQELVPAASNDERPAPKLTAWPFVAATSLVSLAGAVASLLRSIDFGGAEANTVMIFLATVAWIAFRYGHTPAILASVLSVLVFDFFFVPPYRTFAVADAQYIVTFLVMLTIGLVISTLTSRLKAQVASIQKREQQASTLYDLGKQLSSLYGHIFLAGAAGTKLARLSSGQVAIYLRNARGEAELVFGKDTSIDQQPLSVIVAQWVIDHDQTAGAGTNTLPNAAALFLPVRGSQQVLGSVAIQSQKGVDLFAPEMRRLIAACIDQFALAIERDQLAIDAADARVKAEAESLRSSLLSCVSHDLKTPLAAISGASSLLQRASLEPETQHQLLETISDEADRLNRLLENVLQMSKLESGMTTPAFEWHVLEELIGNSLSRMRRELQGHRVDVRLAPDLPLIYVDGLLLEQVFVNLLENAARYTPAESQIIVRAAATDAVLNITVSDNGSGIPLGEEDRIFEKFYRAAANGDGTRGSGLGLAIVQAIVKAHSGTVIARRSPEGGAEFLIRLPLKSSSPQVVMH